jgi:hypothetical protein
MNRRRVGEDRGSRETDRCPLTLSYQKSNDFPDIDSPKVINFSLPPLLIPHQHWMSLRHIGTGPYDTTVTSAVTWMAIYERLGTGRLGTVILSISCVVRPSQGSLECSLWISPG